MSAAAACAAVIVEQLIGLGVADAVLSPGSRDAPLAYALLAADRSGRLRLHVRVDERSAAFLALGLAKAGSRPVPVVTTSGSAAANLHPATLEAWHSGVSLLLITADRPTSMIGTGANQTTVQRGLFAAHVRSEAQLDADLGDPKSWRHQVARLFAACAGTRSGAPGPVHLNVAFGDPLVPGSNDARDLVEDAVPAVQIQRRSVGSEAVELDPAPATVVVAGDASPAVGARAMALAAQGRLPLFAEPSSNARGSEQAISSYRLLLGSSLAGQIERVVVFGHPTLSRPVQRLLGRRDVEVVVVADRPDWTDPTVSASRVLDAVEVAPSAGEGSEGGPAAWLDRWREADARLRPRIDALIGPAGPARGRLTGPALAQLLWRQLGDDDVLVAGSSNPIRDLDLVAPQPVTPQVYANRGLAGIDGTVSTAIGVALAAGRPTHVLLGDLTFLHDANGLLVGPGEPRPDLRIVVANDDGGSIFATLEQGAPELAYGFERLFGTAQGVDIGALCAASGTPHRRVDDAEQVSHSLNSPPRGLEVLEVMVDREYRRAVDEALQSAGATER